jgi:hypothetical protein
VEGGEAMRRELATELSEARKSSIRDATSLRAHLDEKLSSGNISQEDLAAREAAINAIDQMTQIEEQFIKPENYRKIRVKDNYEPNSSATSDLHIPLLEEAT